MIFQFWFAGSRLVNYSARCFSIEKMSEIWKTSNISTYIFVFVTFLVQKLVNGKEKTNIQSMALKLLSEYGKIRIIENTMKKGDIRVKDLVVFLIEIFFSRFTVSFTYFVSNIMISLLHSWWNVFLLSYGKLSCYVH